MLDKIIIPPKGDQPAKDKPIRVLALCDSPTAATGFAQVSKNILRYLAATDKYEIDVIGINYLGDYYDRKSHPYNIYPAQPQGFKDMYGRGRLLNAINGHEQKSGLVQGWDIIFTIQDPFIIEGLGLDFPFAEQLKVASELWKRSVPPEFWFKWIGYFPVDSALKENWVTRSIALADVPVAYCQWGLGQILQYDRDKFETTFNMAEKKDESKRKAKLFTPSLKDRAKVIHHGVDLSIFKPLPDKDNKEFRKKFFPKVLKDDTYLVVNISRNQPRKDVARTMQAFSLFKKRVPNSHLYMHCKIEDVGGSIHEIARNFGLVAEADYTVPSNFSAGIGYPVEIVNQIYNAADLCMTTTLGEGWGFITTEAMATRTPIVAPYITSIIDIFGGDPKENWSVENVEKNEELRGIPVKAGTTTSEWICMGIDDNERIRPLTNVDDLVEKMVWAHNNPEAVSKIVERGFQWVQPLDWANIGAQWDKVFQETYSVLQKERELGYKIDKAGRNDPCPCGSEKKFKVCHGDTEGMAKFKDWMEQDTDDPKATEQPEGGEKV